MADTQKVKSTVDLKALYPQCSKQPVAFLELVEKDSLSDFNNSITFWEGPSENDCVGTWETKLNQLTKKLFEVPGIPYKFAVVNSQIYYRKNVE